MSGAHELQRASEPTEWSRASGKAILFGEHAVVHGVRAIAAGLSRGVDAHVEPRTEDNITVNGVQLERDHQLFEALSKMRAFLGAQPVELTLRSEIPRGSGLGSSAAMAVACARALSRQQSLELSERRLFDSAQAWEQVFHGNPSGVDVAAAQASTLIGYVRGEHPERLSLAQPLHLVIIQAGPPASTKRMVETVAKHKNRNPLQFDKNLEAISSLVENSIVLLRQGDLSAVGKLMDLNHMILAGWMLSTEDIENACSTARSAGALGAKLTGAGGGGCVIALADGADQQSRILAAFEATTMPAFTATVGKDVQ